MQIQTLGCLQMQIQRLPMKTRLQMQAKFAHAKHVAVLTMKTQFTNANAHFLSINKKFLP